MFNLTGFSQLEILSLWCVLGTAVLGLLYAGFLCVQVLAHDKGTAEMQRISNAILIGSNAYLYKQFKTIAFLILLVTGALYFTAGTQHLAVGRACAFLMGSIFSAMVGFVGMNLAVRGNVRVAAAANRGSFSDALKIAYRTGTVTGMLTDGLGLFGGTLIFMVYGEKAYEVLLGFGFGGTLLALFMRVGGGIFTKAADVGADIVGKIEKDLPEDDPRNAATIADNVGDNVGDCAGMASDIFESYEVTIVAAMILGWASYGHQGVIFPLLVRAIGVIASMIGTYMVKTTEDIRDAMKAITNGFFISAAVSVIGFVAVGFFYFRKPEFEGLPFWANLGIQGLDMRPVWTTFVGIVLALAIQRLTQYFTHTEHKPVKSIAESCQTGHATAIITGLAVGLESTVWAILVIGGAIAMSAMIYVGTDPTFVAYGVAMCGIGMLTLTGDNISMDVFGPVADNANGIGEMAKLPNEARRILSDLDAVGNTTKAITKGIAIASAVVAAISLFNAYITDISNITHQAYDVIAASLSVSYPNVFIGLLIGGAIPFMFSALTIKAVGRAAFLIVKEVREQLKDKEIWEGSKVPDYARVVAICTSAAQKELIRPGVLAIAAPLIVGFLLKKEALGGFLAGMILSGQLLAVFMSNAGGGWDNAKKLIEDGTFGGKGSDAHKASVTGDTVGDPLKDTAGPALNPLIKVMNMVALLAIPLVVKYENSQTAFWLAAAGAAVLIGFILKEAEKSQEELEIIKRA